MIDTHPAHVHVTLRLERGADPIAGSCRREDGEPEGFVGWLGLIAVLERAYAAAQAERPQSATQPRD